MKRQISWIALTIALMALTACGGGKGVDICGGYSEPESSPFVGEPGSIVTITPTDHVRGPEEALITMLVYSSFDCADCVTLSLSMNDLVKAHEDTRYVFRHFATEGKALQAAMATETAAALGGEEAFWALHDLLLTERGNWVGSSEEAFTAWLEAAAGQIGLDQAAFSAALTARTYENRVQEQVSTARGAGISQAPVMAINDFAISAPPVKLASLNLLREAFLPARLYHQAPPMVIDPAKNYRAWLETSKGMIVVDLFADIAPQTVNNFAYLSCSGYYDNVIWHRVIEGFVAQTGDPSGTGLGGPGYTIPDENITDAYLARGMSFNRAGLLAMAKSNAPNSARSQFFFTMGPATHLDSGFTIFGEIMEGLDVLDELLRYEARGVTPPAEGIVPDRLISVVVREVED